jgi:hypothetical protein
MHAAHITAPLHDRQCDDQQHWHSNYSQRVRDDL